MQRHHPPGYFVALRGIAATPRAATSDDDLEDRLRGGLGDRSGDVRANLRLRLCGEWQPQPFASGDETRQVRLEKTRTAVTDADGLEQPIAVMQPAVVGGQLVRGDAVDPGRDRAHQS